MPKNDNNHECIYNKNIKESTTYVVKEKTDERIAFGPPDKDEFVKYCMDNGSTEDDANYYFNYYTTGGWCDVNGKPVKNWKLKVLNRIHFDKEKKGSAEKRESAQQPKNTYSYGKRQFDPEYIPNPNWKP